MRGVDVPRILERVKIWVFFSIKLERVKMWVVFHKNWNVRDVPRILERIKIWGRCLSNIREDKNLGDTS